MFFTVIADPGLCSLSYHRLPCGRSLIDPAVPICRHAPSLEDGRTHLVESSLPRNSWTENSPQQPVDVPGAAPRSLRAATLAIECVMYAS